MCGSRNWRSRSTTSSTGAWALTGRSLPRRWCRPAVTAVDLRMAWCGQPMPGDLDRTTPSDVGDHELVALDPGPHDLLSQRVRNRVDDTAVADRGRPGDFAGLAERRGVSPLRQAMQ